MHYYLWYVLIAATVRGNMNPAKRFVVAFRPTVGGQRTKYGCSGVKKPLPRRHVL